MTKPDTTKPTEQPREDGVGLEQWLLTTEGVRHTMKLVPESQRELFAFEMAGHIQHLSDDRLQAFADSVRAEVLVEPPKSFDLVHSRTDMMNMLFEQRKVLDQLLQAAHQKGEK